jgi:hypothetical protein
VHQLKAIKDWKAEGGRPKAYHMSIVHDEIDGQLGNFDEVEPVLLRSFESNLPLVCRGSRVEGCISDIPRSGSVKDFGTS